MLSTSISVDPTPTGRGQSLQLWPCFFIPWDLPLSSNFVILIIPQGPLPRQRPARHREAHASRLLIAGSSAIARVEQKKCFAQSLAPLVLLKTVFLFNLAGPRGAVCPLLVRPVFAPRVLACVVLGPSGVGARRRVAVAGAGRRSGGSCAAPFAPSGPSGWSPGAVAVPVAAPLRSAACGLRSLRSLRPPKEDERARSNVNTRQSCGAS